MISSVYSIQGVSVIRLFDVQEPRQKCGPHNRTVFIGEQTLHNIHLPVFRFHIQNAIAQDSSNTSRPRPQRS